MATTNKVTFTLDEGTVRRIELTAERLGIPKSAVVREAVTEFAARAGRLSDAERDGLLAVFDDVLERIPKRSASAVSREVNELRDARRGPGRRS